MTMILACASRHRVLQVSDRQLTRIHPITNARSSVPEPATKTVVFENRAIFGYTGLSVLERKPADLWIADTISVVADGNVMQAIAEVAARLNRAFRPFRVPDPVPYHAVIASGFRELPGEAFQSFNALIANSPNEQQRPRRTFEVEIFDAPAGGMAVTQAPVWLPDRELSHLIRSLERAGRGGATFNTATDIFVRTIRDVAREHMEVGADLIAASLPAPANKTLGGAYMGLGRPQSAGGSFEYLSESGSGFHFAPTLVMNGVITHDICGYHSE